VLLGIPVVDGHSEELIDWYERCLPDLDEAAGPEIDFRCIGDPGRSGPVHQSLLTPEERERDARDAAFYVESVHQTGRGRAHRLDGMKQLRQMLRLESDAIPCVAFVRPGETEVVGLLRIAPHWYGTRSAGQAFARCLCAWLGRKDVKKVATDGTAVAVTARRLEPLLDALTTEIETAVATAGGTEPEASIPGNMFRWDGEHWRVVWQGTELPRLPRLSGLEIIHFLLEHPEKDYPLEELLGRTLDQKRSISVPRPNPLTATDEWVAEGDVEISGQLETAIPSGSPRARQEIKAELKRCYELKRSQEEYGGQASPDLKEKIERLVAQVGADYEMSGRSRYDSQVRHSAQTRVNTALKRALKRVADHCPPLAVHLKSSIRRGGAAYAYRPEPSIDWIL